MTDQRYEIMLKDLDCCQNCIHFSLGMHFDGCGEGWCHRGKWTIHLRADVCDKYKRRIKQEAKNDDCEEVVKEHYKNETNTIYEDFLKDIDQEPISEMREIKEGWL